MKLDMVEYYKEVLRFQICLYLKFIKKNEFPYQYKYWLRKLKSALNYRKILLKEIEIKKYKPNQQLKLF